GERRFSAPNSWALQVSVNFDQTILVGGKMSHTRKLQFLPLAVILVLAFSLQTARAQSVYGTIAGNVTDASGAAISDATVTLTNLGTSEKHTMQSSSSGQYTFVNVLPGRYRIEG